MNTRSLSKTTIAIAILLTICPVAFPQTDPASNAPTRALISIPADKPGGKEILIPRIEKVAARYANQHTTSITNAGDNWYQIVPDKCPQNYGYNAIKLKVPAANTKFLWLVAMGAATEHWIRAGGRGRRAAAAAPALANEQWPFEFNLTGTAPDDSIIH